MFKIVKKATLAKLQEDLKNEERKVHVLNGEVDSLGYRLEKEKAENATSSETKIRLKKEVQRINDLYRAASESEMVAKAELKKAKKDLESKTARVAELQNEVAELHPQVQETIKLQRQISNQKQSIDKYQTQTDELRAANVSLINRMEVMAKGIKQAINEARKNRSGRKNMTAERISGILEEAIKAYEPDQSKGK